MTMLLNWDGFHVRKTEVANAMPKEPLPNGSVGGNPELGYIGDPFTLNGLGVYHLASVKLLNEYVPHQALDLTGQTFSQVLT